MALPNPPRDPRPQLPPRSPNSVRRTSNIDMLHDGDMLTLRGVARDLATDAEGRGTVLADGSIEVELDGDRILLSIQTTPELPGSDSLIGLHVGRGFRAAATAILPDEMVAQPVALLLDDLPVAAIVSAYSRTYEISDDDGSESESGSDSGSADGEGGRPNTLLNTSQVMLDICSGWRSDGELMASLRDGDGMSLVAPTVPEDEDLDDPLAWHEMLPLGRGVMRRSRIIDLAVGDPTDTSGHDVALWAWFRDSHCSVDDHKTVLHEYEVAGRIEPNRGPLSECIATPRVLPFPDCPAAAASAGRLVGFPLSEISHHVRKEFRGVSTCTHLNDLFRSVGDVESLLAPRVDAASS